MRTSETRPKSETVIPSNRGTFAVLATTWETVKIPNKTIIKMRFGKKAQQRKTCLKNK